MDNELSESLFPGNKKAELRQARCSDGLLLSQGNRSKNSREQNCGFKKKSCRLKILACRAGTGRMLLMKRSALYLLCFVLFSACAVPEPANPKGPAPNVTETPSSVKSSGLVDCNYYWPARRRHVCIKEMPVKECEELFYMSGFQREKECVCDVSGRKKNRVDGGSYIQYDCEG